MLSGIFLLCLVAVVVHGDHTCGFGLHFCPDDSLCVPHDKDCNGCYNYQKKCSDGRCVSESKNCAPAYSDGCIDGTRRCSDGVCTEFYEDCSDTCKAWEQWCPGRGCAESTVACDKCTYGQKKCPHSSDPMNFTCIPDYNECGARCKGFYAECQDGTCQMWSTLCEDHGCHVSETQCENGECVDNEIDCVEAASAGARIAYIVIPILVLLVVGFWCYRCCRNKKPQSAQKEPVNVQFDAGAGGDAAPNATVHLLPANQGQPGSYPTTAAAPYPPAAAPYPPPVASPYPPPAASASCPPPNSYPPQAPYPQVAQYPSSGYPPPSGNLAYPSYPTQHPAAYPPQHPAAYPPSEGADSRLAQPPSLAPRAPSPSPSAPAQETPAYAPPEYHGYDASAMPPPPSYEEVTGVKA